MTPAQQLIAQMRPEEPGAAGHKTCGHDHQAYGLRPRTGRARRRPCGASRRTVRHCWRPRPRPARGARRPRSTRARSPRRWPSRAIRPATASRCLSGATADAPLLLVQRDSVGPDPRRRRLRVELAEPVPRRRPTPSRRAPPTSRAQARPPAATGRAARRRALPGRRHRPVRGARPRRRRRLRRDAGDDRAGELRPAQRPVRRDLAGRHDRDRLRRHALAPARRAAYAARLSGNEFGKPRVISLTGAGPRHRRRRAARGGPRRLDARGPRRDERARRPRECRRATA